MSLVCISIRVLPYQALLLFWYITKGGGGIFFFFFFFSYQCEPFCQDILNPSCNLEFPFGCNFPTTGLLKLTFCMHLAGQQAIYLVIWKNSLINHRNPLGLLRWWSFDCTDPGDYCQILHPVMVGPTPLAGYLHGS